MPIKSYLAHPKDGMKHLLIDEFSEIKECEITPAENENILVVVTDTENETQENKLKEKLDSLKNIKHLVLVSGFNSPQKN